MRLIWLFWDLEGVILRLQPEEVVACVALGDDTVLRAEGFGAHGLTLDSSTFIYLLV